MIWGGAATYIALYSYILYIVHKQKKKKKKKDKYRVSLLAPNAAMHSETGKAIYFI